MPDLPSGTVTFLFTDIEGSTRLWEREPKAMGVALARHDELLREVIGQNEGSVFATGGDAFCAAFPTATNALAAALSAQMALAREGWPEQARIRVRMALHTGAAEVRGHDYFGQPVNRVARLLSAGHGGQILLSLATQELVRDSLPPKVHLRDLGDRRLKDLIRPERVYQLVTPDLPAEFPALKTLDARAHNLPIQPTSFVGREQEMLDIKALLSASRLVTLTGSGGAGKTRLALQVAADCVDDRADGVWFVELAPVTDARLVPQAVASVLEVKEQPGMSLTDTLIEEMKGKELLFLLDNCEHVVEASAQLCQALLAACPNVRILATSREGLRILGEATFRVPSLPAPNPTAAVSTAVLSQYAAVQLFIERAIAVNPAFQVSNANAPAVASICHRLDGLPLALELAAARLRSMSVDEVNSRLDERFRLLTGGLRNVLPRQRALRALIDWSYDLLHDAERDLLRGLAVFAGGWTLEAANRVAGGKGLDEWPTLDLLTSLTDKSMVVAEERNGATRYRLLETVRQYARDRLREQGDEAHWQEQHRAYFLALAAEAEPHLRGENQQLWFDRFEAEHDNLRAALAWSVTAGGQAGGGLQLAALLYWFWLIRGYLVEGRHWASQLLAAVPAGEAATARAKLLNGAGLMAWQQGDYPTARVLHNESLAIRRELGEQLGIASSLNNLGLVTREQGDLAAARALYEESRGIYAALGDRQGVAIALGNLGIIAQDQGDYQAARALHEEGLATRRDLGDPQGIAMALNNLGGLATQQADFASAQAMFDESLAIRRKLGERNGIAASLVNLGALASEQGDLSTARVMCEESLGIYVELGDRQSIAEVLGGLGYVASELVGPQRAARIWGAAERLREEVGSPLPPNERSRYERQVAAARAASGDDAAFDLAWTEGRAMKLADAIEYTLAKRDG